MIVDLHKLTQKASSPTLLLRRREQGNEASLGLCKTVDSVQRNYEINAKINECRFLKPPLSEGFEGGS